MSTIIGEPNSRGWLLITSGTVTIQVHVSGHVDISKRTVDSSQLPDFIEALQAALTICNHPRKVPSWTQ